MGADMNQKIRVIYTKKYPLLWYKPHVGLLDIKKKKKRNISEYEHLSALGLGMRLSESQLMRSPKYLLVRCITKYSTHIKNVNIPYLQTIHTCNSNFTLTLNEMLIELLVSKLKQNLQ